MNITFLFIINVLYSYKKTAKGLIYAALKSIIFPLKEMEKIIRVTQPDLKIFVAESITGNDATEQAKAFNEIANIDGTILTKADVDEKGGTAISIGLVTGKPILYLGVGQEYKDLIPFSKQKFVDELGL